MTILSDPSNVLTVSSNNSGSTNRWMSPELVKPRHFGFEKTCHTKSSDCYAFGMVIYEVISGNPPFYEDGNFSVYRMVLSGEHPSRGTAFPDHLWKMMKLCWAQPDKCPRIEDVLEYLETAPDFPDTGGRPPSTQWIH